MARHPVRYSVQRAAGPKWKTIHLEEDQRRAFKVLREVVKVNPRGYFRLIRLDHNADRSDHATMEFDWKLLELYDPKQGGFQKGFSPAGGPLEKALETLPAVHDPVANRPARGGRERIPMPVRIYIAAAVLGLCLAVLLTVLYGPELAL